MKITINDFHGTLPGINKSRLPLGYAQVAHNCDFKDGLINPIPQTGVGTKTLPAGTKSVFYYEPPGSSDAGVYTAKTQLSDFIQDSISGHDVLYISGQTALQYLDYYTGTTQNLSFDMPMWPQTVTIPSDINTVASGALKTTYTDVFSVSYVVTHVNDKGWESMPSNPSKPVSIYTSGAVPGVSGDFIMMGGYRTDASAWRYAECTGITISNLDSGVKKRIYRSQADAGGSAEFLFVRELNTTETSWTDYTANKTLYPATDDVLATEGWTAAPSNLAGIRMASSRSIAGYVKGSRDIYFSEPMIPYAYPEEYKMTMPGIVRQIEPFGEDLIAFMDNHVMILRGSPGEMYASVMPGSNGSWCDSGKGAIVTPTGVIFPGKDGLYFYNGSYAQNISSPIMKESQWMSKRPFMFRAFFHDDKYNAFTGDDTTLHIFDLKDKTYHTADMGIVPVDVHVPRYGLASSAANPLLVPKPPVWLTDGGTTAYPWGLDPTGGVKDPWWFSGIIPVEPPASLSHIIIKTDKDRPWATANYSIKFFRHGVSSSAAPTGELAGGELFNILANEPSAIPINAGVCDSFQIAFPSNQIPIAEVSIATSVTELVNG